MLEQLPSHVGSTVNSGLGRSKTTTVFSNVLSHPRESVTVKLTR